MSRATPRLRTTPHERAASRATSSSGTPRLTTLTPFAYSDIEEGDGDTNDRHVMIAPFSQTRHDRTLPAYGDTKSFGQVFQQQQQQQQQASGRLSPSLDLVYSSASHDSINSPVPFGTDQDQDQDQDQDIPLIQAQFQRPSTSTQGSSTCTLPSQTTSDIDAPSVDATATQSEATTSSRPPASDTVSTASAPTLWVPHPHLHPVAVGGGGGGLRVRGHNSLTDTPVGDTGNGMRHPIHESSPRTHGALSPPSCDTPYPHFPGTCQNDSASHSHNQANDNHNQANNNPIMTLPLEDVYVWYTSYIEYLYWVVNATATLHHYAFEYYRRRHRVIGIATRVIDGIGTAISFLASSQSSTSSIIDVFQGDQTVLEQVLLGLAQFIVAILLLVNVVLSTLLSHVDYNTQASYHYDTYGSLIDLRNTITQMDMSPENTPIDNALSLEQKYHELMVTSPYMDANIIRSVVRRWKVLQLSSTAGCCVDETHIGGGGGDTTTPPHRRTCLFPFPCVPRRARPLTPPPSMAGAGAGDGTPHPLRDYLRNISASRITLLDQQIVVEWIAERMRLYNVRHPSLLRFAMNHRAVGQPGHTTTAAPPRQAHAQAQAQTQSQPQAGSAMASSMRAIPPSTPYQPHKFVPAATSSHDVPTAAATPTLFSHASLVSTRTGTHTSTSTSTQSDVATTTCVAAAIPVATVTTTNTPPPMTIPMATRAMSVGVGSLSPYTNQVFPAQQPQQSYEHARTSDPRLSGPPHSTMQSTPFFTFSTCQNPRTRLQTIRNIRHHT